MRRAIAAISGPEMPSGGGHGRDRPAVSHDGEPAHGRPIHPTTPERKGSTMHRHPTVPARATRRASTLLRGLLGSLALAGTLTLSPGTAAACEVYVPGYVRSD